MVKGLLNTIAHTLQVFQMRNVKNSAFFLFKCIFILIINIIFVEIINI